MRKRLLLTLSLLTSILSTNAQNQIEKIDLENAVVSLNLLAPGISVESAIAKQQSLYFNAALSFNIYLDSRNGTTTSFSPYILAQYRSYYNLDKRHVLGKKTAYNSGNYWGIMIAHQGEPFKESENINIISQEATTVIGPVWGIQRNGTITFGLSLGAGLYFRSSGTEGGIIGSLNLGFNLSKISK